jgi:TPR repeat protein
MLMNGDGAPRDMATAIRWFRRVGSEPLVDAALRLQHLVLGQARIDKGAWLGAPGLASDGAVPKARFDAKQVKALIAADRGKANEQAELGRRFELGDGFAPSPTDAVYWYARAADRHDKNAEKALAAIEATSHEGAEYGDGNRLHFVGLRYLEGRGVKQDAAAAAIWFGKAAVRGSMDALGQLRCASAR